MSLRICLISAMIIPISVCQTQECTRKNVSCNDIKTSSGFKFFHNCGSGTEVSVSHNQTVIANAEPQKGIYNFLGDVISMDNSSIVTKECRDIQIQCFTPNGEYVKETCEEFITAEGMTPDLTTQWSLIVAVIWIIGIIGIVGIIGMLCWCWKNKPKMGISNAESRERNGIRPHDVCEVQNITTHPSSTTSGNDFSLVEIPSVTEPHGSGESDVEGNEQNNTFGDVHVERVDSKVDDQTPQIHSVAYNLSNEKNQPTNGNCKNDPGGVNTMRTIDMNDECAQVDWAQEGQPLLLDQRAAVEVSDMAGKDVALVNKHSFNPDLVSKCSIALDTDVESTPKLKNYGMHKY